jgi:hypothetical protein
LILMVKLFANFAHLRGQKVLPVSGSGLSGLGNDKGNSFPPDVLECFLISATSFAGMPRDSGCSRAIGCIYPQPGNTLPNFIDLSIILW